MKLKCGIFLSERIEEGPDWDLMPIGAHSYVRKMQRENAKTSGYEYYYIKDNSTFIVRNPTLAEKAFALLNNVISKRVVGYRSECRYVQDTKELESILRDMKEKNEMTM